MATTAARLQILVDANVGKATANLQRTDRQLRNTSRAAQNQAAALRRSGKSWQDIGRRMGVSQRQAQRLASTMNRTSSQVASGARRAEAAVVRGSSASVAAQRRQQAALARTATSATASGARVSASQTRMTGAFGRARSAMGGMVRSAVALGAAYIGLRGARTAITNTEALAKTTIFLHDRMRFAVGTASELGAVLQARGIDASKLATAFTTLSKQVRQVGQGSDKATKNFEALGVSQREVAQLRPDELMFRISDGLKRMGPGLKQNAIGSTLFGKGWKDLVPVLARGRSELQGQLDLARKYGATFRGRSLQSIRDWIAAQREAKIAMLGLQVSFATGVAPTLTKAANAFSKFVGDMRANRGEAGQFGQTLSAITASAQQFAKTMLPVVNAVVRFVSQHPALQKMLGVFAATAAVMKGLKVAAAITGITDAVKHLGALANAWRTVGTSAQTATEKEALASSDTGVGPGGRGRFGRFMRGPHGATVATVGATAGLLGGQALGGPAGNVLSGAATGASLGMLAGPEGAAIGGGLGAAIGAAMTKSIRQFIGRNLRTVIALAFGPIPALISALFSRNLRQGIGRGFAGAAGVVARGAATIFNPIKHAASSVWTAVRGFFSRGMSGALGVLRAGTGPQRAAAAVVGRGIQAGFNVLRRLPSFVSGIFAKILGVLRAATGPQRAAARLIASGISKGIHAISSVPGFVSRIFGRMLRFLRSVPGKAAGALGKLGGMVKDKIVSAFEGAVNKVIDFVNKIIGVINKIPGVPNIGKIGHLGGGNVRVPNRPGAGGQHQGRARGGFIDHPMLMVGEEAPKHPEYVIASNPRYRKRNMELWSQAGQALGIPGFAFGGKIGDVAHKVGGAAKDVLGATPTGRLLGGAKDLIGKLPGVGDLPKWMAGMGKWVIKQAKKYITDKFPDLGGLFGGASSSHGLVPQVKRALAWARSHGWHGGVTSGFRSHAEQAMLYARYLAGGNIAARPGSSEHERGRAVDITDIPGFARAMASAPSNAKLLSLVPGDPVHFSVSGHKMGGIIGQMAKGGGWRSRINRRFFHKGSYSTPDLRTLWVVAGGNPHVATLMAHVAQAESGGDPRAHDASGATGLWQILGNPFPGNAFDPLTNAKMAVSKYRGGGTGPWDASKSGWGRWAGFRDSRLPSTVRKLMGRGGGGTGTGRGGGGHHTHHMSPAQRKAHDRRLKKLRAADKRRMKKLGKRLRRIKGLGLSKAMESALTKASNDAAVYGEYAQRAGALTTTADDGTTTQGVVGGKDEGGWLNLQLSGLFSYRNKLIAARERVNALRDYIADQIKKARKRYHKLGRDIKKAAARKNVIAKKLKVLRRHPKRNRRAIAKLHGESVGIDRLQHLRVFNRKAIKDKLLPAFRGQDSKLKDRLPDLASELETTQGLAAPQGVLKSLPTVGVLGGSIFDVQSRLRELGAPAAKATAGATTDDSGLADLLRQQLDTANLRTAVSEAQFKAFRNVPPFGGSFATGGIVPGPVGAPRTIVAHGGETVGQPGDVQVIINGDIVGTPRGKDPVEIVTSDPRFHAAVQQSNRRVSRGVGRTPGRAGSY